MDSTPLLRRSSFLIGLAVVVALLAGADYLYFNSLEAAEPTESSAEVTAALPAQDVCSYDETKPRVENYADWVSFSDPPLSAAVLDDHLVVAGNASLSTVYPPCPIP